MDLTINGLKKSRVTITNELQQYQLGKGSNNKKIQSYFINSLLLQLKTVDKTEHFINEISQSAETTPKQVIYKIINFYREINNQQSKNNENLDELKRFTEKVYESKTASLDKANELTEQIIKAYSGNYTKDFLNAIIEIVILILNDYIVMRKMYCRYVCSKFQVKEGEKKCQK